MYCIRDALQTLLLNIICLEAIFIKHKGKRFSKMNKTLTLLTLSTNNSGNNVKKSKRKKGIKKCLVTLLVSVWVWQIRIK